MEMLLMGLCITLFGLAVAALAFGAATRPEAEAAALQPELQPELQKAIAMAPAHFFAAKSAKAADTARVPIEALLLQIENHIRLEQAAAESFLESPTAALLHGKTTSPFVN